jgi:hypothetical protein
MLGLLALGFTSLMIYTLVKNALFGIQLNKTSSYHGTIELIVCNGPQDNISFEHWGNALSSYSSFSDQLIVHFLFDGLHSDLGKWQQLSQGKNWIKIHHFTQRPSESNSCPWMIDQISSSIQSSIVLITDSQTIPSNEAIISLGSFMLEKQTPIYAIPQTAQVSTLSETIFSLNPTLSFISLFGIKKWRRHFAKNLFSITDGLLCVDQKFFKELNFKASNNFSWKELFFKNFEDTGLRFQLAFGEKFLKRYHSQSSAAGLLEISQNWESMWSKKNKLPFWIFAASVFVWSFPLICLFTHPFWAMASFFLLVLYRFFTKIVFQESWTSVILHPVGSAYWIIGLFKFILKKFRQGQA